MVERQMLRREACRLDLASIESPRKCGSRCKVLSRFPSLNQDQRTEARQFALKFADDVASIEQLASVAHSVHRDQRLGGDLTKAVQYRLRAHIGCTHAPDCADACTSQKPHHRLRTVVQIGGHPVTANNAEVAKRESQSSDLMAQLAPSEAAHCASLVLAYHRRLIVGLGRFHVPKHVGGIVDLRPIEPDGAGHRLGRKDTFKRRRRGEAVIVPDAAPKALQILYRPTPKRVIAIKVQPTVKAQPIRLETHLRNGMTDHGLAPCKMGVWS